jgi:hypothetical protein
MATDQEPINAEQISGRGISEPRYEYDADLSELGQAACNRLFGIIEDDAELVTMELGAGYQSTEDVLNEAGSSKDASNPSHATRTLLALSEVFQKGYDFSVGYDEATERAAKKLLDSRRTGPEATRLARVKLFAARRTLFASQQPAAPAEKERKAS